MGADASAKLCFGVELHRSDEMPWGEDDVGTWWAEQNGMPSWEAFKADPAHEGKSYSAELKKFKAENACPVAYCYAGFEGETLLYHVPGTYYSSPDWGTVSLDVGKLVVSPESVRAFLEFFEKNNVKLPKEPSWILASYYG